MNDSSNGHGFAEREELLRLALRIDSVAELAESRARVAEADASSLGSRHADLRGDFAALKTELNNLRHSFDNRMGRMEGLVAEAVAGIRILVTSR